MESVDKPPRFVINSGGIAVHIRVAEHFEAEVVKPRDNLSRTEHWKGTGVLRLFLSHESWSSPKCITDSPQERLEDKSETIFQRLTASSRLHVSQISNGKTVNDGGRRKRKERRRSGNGKSASGSA